MSSLADWVPLSQRSGASPAAEALLDGAPEHLWRPLVDWISTVSNSFTDLALKLRLPYEPPNPLTALPGEEVQQFSVAIRGSEDPEKKLLDAVEGALVILAHNAARGSAQERRIANDSRRYHVERLDRILSLGGSRWMTNNDGTLLVERVPPAVAAAFEAALTNSPSRSVSEHLRASWAAAYGREPNPTYSYGEAIKAVEASAAPIVSPKNPKPTLGTILRDLKAAPRKWSFAIHPGSMDPVIAAAQVLWDGQTDRHGGVGATRAIEPDAARAAVMLAVTLVHWFGSGSVELRR